MPEQADFPAVFAALKERFAPFAAYLTLTRDDANEYYLDAGYSAHWKRTVAFGGVRSGKAYVSYHLVPVYVYP